MAVESGAGSLIFRVDFNHFDEEGELLIGALPHAQSLRRPEPGERVFLQDREGNHCYATVARLEGEIVYFELDDATWASDEDVAATGRLTRSKQH